MTFRRFTDEELARIQGLGPEEGRAYALQLLQEAAASEIDPLTTRWFAKGNAVFVPDVDGGDQAVAICTRRAIARHIASLHNDKLLNGDTT